MADAGAKGDVRIEEPTRAEQTAARRTAEAKAIVPELSVATEIDLEEPVDDDRVVHAAARALTEFPRVNGAYRDGKFELYSRVNVGVAVAGADGVVFPTIFDADQKDVATIAIETAALTQRAVEGVITAAELRGATFSVASVSAHGATDLVPILNAPQAAILAVGATRRLPRFDGDAVVARHVLPLRLVADARVLSGADAARFLARIGALLQA